MNVMFVTNQYKVLEVMYENRLKVIDEEYCPLGQAEVAKKLHLSRVVVNRIFSELKEAGYVTMITRGKWKLSSNACEMIKVMRKL